MKITGALSYHFNVNLLGHSFLRYERLRSTLKMRKPHPKQNPHLAPLLKSVPHLKELISSHYLRGRYADQHQKVAWVTSGAPVEFLKALGFHTYYPENHGAVCGVRRQAVELSSKAEACGYSRDLCSYARTDIGSVLSGETPVGRVSRPDLLVCCTNICQTVLYWYQVLADHFKVPLVVIDTPFIYDEVSDHAVSYVIKQLEYAIETAEKVAGRSMDDARFRVAAKLAKDAASLWNEIIQCCKHRPSPISAFDEFFFMAPVVDMRGEAVTVRFYEKLLAEVQQRIKDGIGAVTNEKHRLLWDNLPIWYFVRELAEKLAENGYAIVTSTYTNAWGELAPLIQLEQGLESMARAYLHVILNRTAGHKLRKMQEMIDEYSLDGVILHNNRSCKPYSIGQIDQRDKLINEIGVPTLLLEADHNDMRSFSKQQITNRLDTFFELFDNR